MDRLWHPRSLAHGPTYGFGVAMVFGTFALLAIVYSSVLFETFVYVDEHKKLSSHNSDRDILPRFEQGLRLLGRPVTRVSYGIFKRIAGEGWSGIIWVRVVSLALSAIFITTVSLVLGRAWNSCGVALATAIFLAGTPAIQVTAFYSMLSPYMLGHVTATGAAALVMLTNRQSAFWFRCGLAFVMLQVSWFVFQVAPFMAGPIAAAIAFAALAHERKPLVRGQIIVLTLLMVTMAIFIAIFRSFSDIRYERAENAVEMLDDVGGFDLDALFETIDISKIFETAYLTDLLAPLVGSNVDDTLSLLYSIMMLAFVICVTMYLGRVRLYSANYFVSLGLSVGLLLSAYVPLVADHFSGRQHVSLPAALSWWVVLVSSFFLAQLCLSRQVRLGIRPYGIAAGIVLGTGHLIMSGLAVKVRVADPYSQQMSYMQSHLAEEFGGVAINRLTMVEPDRKEVRDLCLLAPCIGFYARGPMEVRRWRDAVPMRELAKRAGVADGPREIVIVEPGDADPHTLRLDTFAHENFGVGGKRGLEER